MKTNNEIILLERDKSCYVTVLASRVLPREVSMKGCNLGDLVEFTRKYLVNLFKTEKIVVTEAGNPDLHENFIFSLGAHAYVGVTFRHSFKTNSEINEYKIKHPRKFQLFAKTFRKNREERIFAERLGKTLSGLTDDALYEKLKTGDL